ncbi:homocysteine-responsive endoplasmic reticulum-resident ubiquitin-like domain member 2 protein isoform X2 [Sabethes cyaneus]|uniref:homocysteine-responsive endoplasmic reticulum-resident ubiquitin-like domain member 2 protein isoform X2 n=1 Tax=Sabethes cyaneus TaxID=53552 RepID=UPI00237DBD20|nr:homocysteine-responsive endoplasmic reticulum-resident ubiquitin-like domain member 2 protein isoform X2 [Sabethes cyaneus]
MHAQTSSYLACSLFDWFDSDIWECTVKKVAETYDDESTDEQKLIYSGQLLSDSVILKDVLRQYDGQQAYTVHLVFTPKNNRFHKDPGDNNSKSSTSKTMAPKLNSETDNVQTSANVARSSGESSRTHDAASARANNETDGLRHRNAAAGQSTSSVTSDRASSFPTCPISTASADHIMGQQLAMQNWMQQTYMQYFTQYMNAISSAQIEQQTRQSDSHNFPVPRMPQPNLQQIPAMPITAANANPVLAQTTPNLAYYPYLSTLNSSQMPSASSIPAPITSSGTILTNPLRPTNVPAAVSSSSPAPASVVLPKGSGSPAVPPAEAATGSSTGAAAGASSSVQTGRTTPDGTADATVDRADAANGAPGAAADPAPAPARRFPNIVVEEQENRDWLDIFFSMCRVGILMTVVYMYSSPVRCLTVFVIGASLYLYQIGFFRNNNADRLERARQIVVQQLNNAHGIRPNGVGRDRPAGAPAPEEDRNGVGADSDMGATAATAEDGKDATNSTEAEKDVNTATTENSTTAEQEKKLTSTASEPVEEATLSSTEPASAGTVEVDDLTSTVIPEQNRVNLNDVATFLRTLVLSFFTSIIPDTPAA